MPTSVKIQAPIQGSAGERLTALEVFGLIALLGGSFMVVLDFFIVMVALPSIQADLHASSASIQMVVTGYGIANAVAFIAGGRLGDIYGRQRMFQLGLGLFVIASIACAAAPSTLMLIAARIAQGLAGALLQPQVLGTLSSMYSSTKRARVFAWYGVAMGSAGLVGQLLGGALIQLDVLGSGWRSCFLINGPIGIAALVLVRRCVPADVGHGSRVDLVGTMLSATALLLLTLPLTYGREQGWPRWTVACVPAFLAVAMALFRYEVTLERAGGSPLLPTALFRVKSFSAGIVRVLIFYSGVASFYFILALHLQQDLGFSALAAGSMFAVLVASFVTTSMCGARLHALLGRAGPMVGTGILIVGHAAMAMAVWQRADSTMVLAMCLVVQGCGIGLTMVPLVSSTLAGAPSAHAGVAGGVLSTFQQTGNSLGVTLIGLLFFGATARSGFLVSLEYLIGINVVLSALLFTGLRRSRCAGPVKSALAEVSD